MKPQTRNSFFVIGVAWLVAISTNSAEPFASPNEDVAVNEAIKIYDGSNEDGDEPVTLDGFFESTMALEMIARKETTKLRQYRNSITRFTAFLANATNTTSIRGIATISDLDAIQWQQHEVDLGLEPSTVNVHWTRIRAVLRRAGPPEKGNPQGMSIITRIPYLRALTTPKPKPKVVSTETIDAIYVYGAPDMTWPDKFDGVTPALVWRCWLVCGYNLAMRTRDLLSLRWENVIDDPQSLDPDSENESPYGWVQWVPAKTEHSKPDPLVLPLNQCVRVHLDSIRNDSPYVFGREMATCSNDKLYGRASRPASGQWPRLLDLTSTHQAIPRFKIKALRKTANTAYNRLDRKLGEHILGHAARGVNDMFYQQWEADVIEYVAKLPQPKSFKKEPKPTIRQELMF